MKSLGEASGETLDSEAGEGDGDLGGRASFAAALAREIGDEDEPGEPADDDGEPARGGGKPAPLPKDLNALAERLGVEVSELYNLAVPVGHGREPLTLGKLKDRGEAWASLEADRLAFSEGKVEQESHLTRQRQELQELLSMVPKEQLLNKEVLTRVAQRVTERNRAQDAQVTQLIPEWKDEAVRTKERGEITTMLEGYGLTAPEVAGIRDPRVLKFIRDAVRREQQVRKALESVRPAKRKSVQQQIATRAAPRGQQRETPRSTLRPVGGREQFSQILANEG